MVSQEAGGFREAAEDIHALHGLATGALDQIVLGTDAGLVLSVDYDDVDHETVDKMVKKLVSIIKEHWTEGSRDGNKG